MTGAHRWGLNSKGSVRYTCGLGLTDGAVGARTRHRVCAGAERKWGKEGGYQMWVAEGQQGLNCKGQGTSTAAQLGWWDRGRGSAESWGQGLQHGAQEEVDEVQDHQALEDQNEDTDPLQHPPVKH